MAAASIKQRQSAVTANVETASIRSDGQQTAVADVCWDDLDKPKFYALSFTAFLGLRAVLYPSMLVKTRMQTTGEVYRGTFSAMSHIVRREGVRGIYQGFGVHSLSLFPRQAYFTIYELVRKLLGPESRLHRALGEHSGEVVRNMAAGGSASFFMQLVTVPLDVVTQRLMVAAVAAEGAPRTAGGIIREIYAVTGPRGFYKGFAAAIMQFVPFNSAWWSTYGLYKGPVAAQVAKLPFKIPDEPRQVLVQAVAGYLAGATTVVLTNPLDVVRTRLQVRRDSGATMVAEARALWQGEGVRGLFSGLGPRLVGAAPASVLIVTTYEWVKRVTRKTPLSDA